MIDIDHLYKCFLDSNGVSTDTRKLEPNQMFFALSGDNFNGNKFALSALEKGASYVVVDEDINHHSDKVIKLDNTLEALQLLGEHHRKQLGTTVIGITGSNGKTTTKELINQVLSSQYNCHYTKGNLNNHIGVPLTLLQLESKHELAIIEMGANHIGEIKDLCQMSKPDYGLITNIGKAHLEGFGSIEGVKKGKSELYDYIKSNNGIIFYNGEDTVLEDSVDGYEEAYKYFPSGLVAMNQDSKLLSFMWEEKEVMTHLAGQYNLFNIAAAIFIGRYFKVTDENIANSISEYIPSNNRSQIKLVNGVEYFLDAYNANPTSMKFSLDNFLNIAGEPKILILGDMLELGNSSFEEHKAILSMIADKSFDAAYCIGAEFSRHAAMRTGNIKFYADISELKIYLEKNPIAQDSKVLLKGSRGIGLEKILD